MSLHKSTEQIAAQGRLLVRPYLPVGVDHFGPVALKRSRTRDPIFD